MTLSEAGTKLHLHAAQLVQTELPPRGAHNGVGLGP